MTSTQYFTRVCGRNIYFTPLVHSMYALHLRRWLAVFPAEGLLVVRFDGLVLKPLVRADLSASISAPSPPDLYIGLYGTF